MYRKEVLIGQNKAMFLKMPVSTILKSQFNAINLEIVYDFLKFIIRKISIVYLKLY